MTQALLDETSTSKKIISNKHNAATVLEEPGAYLHQGSFALKILV